ncbi:glutathione S-transferase family protein [Sphingomonadaceae bacterium OTU29MARTA1]|uniref:glutathione S-transferase family protein n=1 Tax=Sphingomonas sp. Leaf37 TaxID=2876552 RepID=UPI001E516536|nr:glutathione S-transferase family protein [Sphingomonas sp. Leaf37]USU06731.1 glutathione S-transferase family protein [Sphingomonadaceae bacterium OTU29LAMAA1]USU10100.1 glutathione S-transferase family protein [Sphingomonadaceae bacterium OTU29MARTA1]USU13550.1 glutathione S-transferase family protein [Sphingomonadaceae bacterium OTU29THOMA1]
MADLILYTNPMSRGRIARWMLEEAGVDYDAVLLDYASTMKEQPFLSVNPMAKVPAIIHGGKTVTECAAICAYLAEAFPGAGLAPREDERADYYRWLFFAAGPVEAAITNRSLGVAPTDQQQRMAGYGTYDRMVDVLEQAVAAHEYIAGDRFTAADVYVGSQVIWGAQFGSLPKRDAFDAYIARLTAREAYERAAALDDAAMAAMAAT